MSPFASYVLVSPTELINLFTFTISFFFQFPSPEAANKMMGGSPFIYFKHDLSMSLLLEDTAPENNEVVFSNLPPDYTKVCFLWYNFFHFCKSCWFFLMGHWFTLKDLLLPGSLCTVSTTSFTVVCQVGKGGSTANTCWRAQWER